MKAEKLVEALQIMMKYGDVEVAVGHDVIYAGPDISETISEEDAERLEELGWFESDEDDCWKAFV